MLGREERFITDNLELFGFYRGNILVQAVKELVDNSYDACRMSERVDSIIKIKIYARDEKVVLEVIDNGIGMRFPQQSFSCFTSSADYSKRIGKYGLGLSVASYVSCCYSREAVLLLTSSGEGQEKMLEVKFVGLSPIITETEGEMITMEDAGTFIQMHFPVSLLDWQKGNEKYIIA